MATHFTAGNGALWAQPDGPNTAPVYLGCHQLGDIDEPRGDVELIYCPDPSAPGRFKVVASFQGSAGAVTTSVTTDVTDELDSLEIARCPITMFVNMVSSGRKDLFSNFDRTFVISNARITSAGLSNLSARTPDDNGRAEMTFDMSGEELLRLREQTISRQSISETTDINDVAFCGEQRCRTELLASRDSCQEGYAACDAVPGSTANVLRTTNGATWTATSADPFSTNEHVISVECFDLDGTNSRVLVARGSTDASNPTEVAYSDDNGATWTNVNVGSTNGEFVQSRHGLFALDRLNLWVVTDGGYIFYSSDGGASWTAQESGAITANGYNCIRFIDSEIGYACGDSNVIVRTIDGGIS